MPVSVGVVLLTNVMEWYAGLSVFTVLDVQRVVESVAHNKVPYKFNEVNCASALHVQPISHLSTE